MTLVLPLALESLTGLAQSGDRTALIDSPELFVGVKTFEPGEVFPNHFHNGFDEFFAGLSGTVTLWEGRSSRFELSAGTSLLSRRGTHHYLANNTDEPARIMFAKIPMVADDVTWVDWEPSA